MASTDDVQLPDLQVIQRYSLAVRGATAPRDDVIAALQADLAWLSGGGRPKPAAKAAPVRTAPAKEAPARSAPVKAATKSAPARTKATAKAPAKKKAGARRA